MLQIGIAFAVGDARKITEYVSRLPYDKHFRFMQSFASPENPKKPLRHVSMVERRLIDSIFIYIGFRNI